MNLNTSSNDCESIEISLNSNLHDKIGNDTASDNSTGAVPGPQSRRPLPVHHAEPAPEFLFTHNPASIADGWRAAYGGLTKLDEKMLKHYHEEIDSILIFAGLFSAVLTGFIVESYHNLQEDYTQSTKDILLHISQQLSDPLSSSAPVFGPDFKPTPSDVWINIVWFISLMLSLASALFGIFAKQWLRSYMSWMDVSPLQTAVGVRQFRQESMQRWKFHEMIMILPILLQMALVLFGVGLVNFCIDLNLALGGAVAVVAACFFAALLFCTFMPLFSASTPYRSPWSAALSRLRFWMLEILVLIHTKTDGKLFMKGFDSWDLAQLKQRWISESVNWNRMDQANMAMRQIVTDKNDEPLQPSWEARGISSLLPSAISEDALISILPCVLSRNVSTMNRQHIADLWHITRSVLGIRPKDLRHVQLNQWKLNFMAYSLSPLMREQLLWFLLRAMSDGVRSPLSDSNSYARQLRTLTSVVWYSHPEEEEPTIIRYMNIVLKIYGRSVDSDTSSAILLDERILQTFAVLYNAPIIRSFSLSPWNLMGLWTMDDVVVHARLVTAVIKSKTFNTSTSQMFSNTGALLAVHQYSIPRSYMDAIHSFLSALDESLAFYQDALRYHGLSLSRNCWFCQSMYVLGSCHPAAFPERLVRSLCTEFLQEITYEDGDISFDMESASVGDTWELFYKLTRQLGTQPFEWTCPGFEPWPDRLTVRAVCPIPDP